LRKIKNLIEIIKNMSLIILHLNMIIKSKLQPLLFNSIKKFNKYGIKKINPKLPKLLHIPLFLKILIIKHLKLYLKILG
jgi:hypothetical protein